METATRARTPRPLAGYGCAGLVVLLWAGFSLSARFSARNGAATGLTP